MPADECKKISARARFLTQSTKRVARRSAGTDTFLLTQKILVGMMLSAGLGLLRTWHLRSSVAASGDSTPTRI